jgi:hypothetical protein
MQVPEKLLQLETEALVEDLVQCRSKEYDNQGINEFLNK